MFLNNIAKIITYIAPRSSCNYSLLVFRLLSAAFIRNILVYFIVFSGLFIATTQAENNFLQIIEENFETTDDTGDNNELSKQEHLPIIKSSIIEANDPIKINLKNCARGKIIALNKITATSKELVLKTGEPEYFGNIKITLHKCAKNLDPYAEDNYLLLTITEHKIDEDPILLFQGWMISSSISLSTFEHPIYEIFAKECCSAF